MRKLIALTGILFLAVGMLAVNTASAGNITIYDGVGVTGSGPGGEDQERETGAAAGQQWDLEGILRSGTQISLVGGYDFKSGEANPNYTPTNGQPQYFLPGNLFIDSQTTLTSGPTYGVAPSGLGATDGFKTVSNTFGYNYVVTTDFTDPLHPTWTLYKITSATQLSTVYYRQFDWSDPFKLLSTPGTDGVSLVGSGALGYQSGLSDVATGFSGGTHYELDYVGLGGLLPGYTTDPNYNAWFHYTYGCGNDFMMGQTSGAQAPLPPSALLLGTGILGLVGLGWRRRRQSS